MPNNKPIAAKGKRIPPDKWQNMMTALNPMAKEGYKTLYKDVYKKDKTNLYPGNRGTDYIDFPSEEYDYKTNPKNKQIVGYVMKGYFGKDSRASGMYKPGKYEEKPHKYLGDWLSSSEQVTPDTIMVSDDAKSPTDIIAHELMHIELPSVGSIEHRVGNRITDDRNQKRFADIINRVKADKNTSGSIRDILELSIYEAYDSEIRDTYK